MIKGDAIMDSDQITCDSSQLAVQLSGKKMLSHTTGLFMNPKTEWQAIYDNRCRVTRCYSLYLPGENVVMPCKSPSILMGNQVNGFLNSSAVPASAWLCQCA